MTDLSTTLRLTLTGSFLTHVYEGTEKKSRQDNSSQDPPMTAMWVWLICFKKELFLSDHRKRLGKFSLNIWISPCTASVLHKIEMITHISRILYGILKSLNPKFSMETYTSEGPMIKDERTGRPVPLSDCATWVIVIVFHIMWLVHGVSWTELLLNA